MRVHQSQNPEVRAIEKPVAFERARSMGQDTTPFMARSVDEVMAAYETYKSLEEQDDAQASATRKMYESWLKDGLSDRMKLMVSSHLLDLERELKIPRTAEAFIRFKQAHKEWNTLRAMVRGDMDMQLMGYGIYMKYQGLGKRFQDSFDKAFEIGRILNAGDLMEGLVRGIKTAWKEHLSESWFWFTQHILKYASDHGFTDWDGLKAHLTEKEWLLVDHYMERSRAPFKSRVDGHRSEMERRYFFGNTCLEWVGPPIGSEELWERKKEMSRLENRAAYKAPAGRPSWGFEFETFAPVGNSGYTGRALTMIHLWFAEIGGKMHTLYGRYLPGTPAPKVPMEVGTDVSISNTRWRSMEVRSPVFPTWEAMLDALRRLQAYAMDTEVLTLPPRCGLHIHAGTFPDDARAMIYASCLMKSPVRKEVLDVLMNSKYRRAIKKYADPEMNLNPIDRSGEINITAMKKYRTVEYRALRAATDFELIERLVMDAMVPCLAKALRRR